MNDIDIDEFADIMGDYDAAEEEDGEEGEEEMTTAARVDVEDSDYTGKDYR